MTASLLANWFAGIRSIPRHIVVQLEEGVEKTGGHHNRDQEEDKVKVPRARRNAGTTSQRTALVW